VSFEKLDKPTAADIFIQCSGKTEKEIQNKIKTSIPQGGGASLIIFDTVHPLMNQTHFNLSAFLASFMGVNTSVVLLCHSDIPFSSHGEFLPDPLSLLRYVATAILTTYSLKHIVARKKARDRSIAQPAFGLEESVDGVLVGFDSNYTEGTVFEMEHRRKSGRTVKAWFFIYYTSQKSADMMSGTVTGPKTADKVILLEDHPLYPRPAESTQPEIDKNQVDSTFSLGLSEKEREDRDAVLLPYFDAQKESGVGDGGRILYDMGAEDDFDEEEDEI
jgi:elongator complex protein 5